MLRAELAQIHQKGLYESVRGAVMFVVTAFWIERHGLDEIAPEVDCEPRFKFPLWALKSTRQCANLLRVVVA